MFVVRGSLININLNKAIKKIIMKNPTLFSFVILLSTVCSAWCAAISELKGGVEEHVEASTPLDVSGKSGEVEIDEKTADLEHTSAETRVERSSEALERDDDNVESKIDPEAETALKSALENDDKSAEIAKVDDKTADVNDAAEEISSERSGSETGLNDAGPESNVNKDTKSISDRSADDQIHTSGEIDHSMPYDTHDILDTKARTADSEENFEVQAKSDLEAISAEAFGSRRSYSGSPGSPAFVTSSRSGLMFDDVPSPMPNPNPAMFNRINQEHLLPNEYYKSPVSSSEYKSHNGPDPYFDPISSSEFKPLDQFNSNPFANSYPYAFQPTTTPNPVDNNRYQDVGLYPKFVQPLESLNRPIVRFFGPNLKQLPQIPIKPLEQNVPFPIFRPFDTRLNQYPPTQPQRFYKKCHYCSST